MDTTSGEAFLNIGAVARMAEIPEATLRMWERRYGFPHSTRSGGGHRLYSHQELARLRWVKARLDEGMQVSRAIRMLEVANAHELAQPEEWLQDKFDPAGAHLVASLRSAIVDALLDHDLEACNSLLGTAHANVPMEQILLEIVSPALAEIGERWERGEIDVATEHLATNHLRHHLLACIRLGPPAFAVRPVVLACAPGELHEGSLLILGALLRRLRWPILYLGQTVPLSDFAAVIEELNPAAVVLVAMMDNPANAIAMWSLRVRDEPAMQTTAFCFGGRAFVRDEALRERVAGIYLGNTLQEGVEALDALMHRLNPRLP